MSMRSVEVDIDRVGESRVVVDGVDISRQLYRVSVDAVAGQPARVALEAHAHLGRITGLADVIEVVEPSGALLAFLDDLDAEWLERTAIERLGGLGDGATTVGGAMIDVLKELARGDHNRT